MLQITFISTERANTSNDSVRLTLARARSNNLLNGITGMVIFDGVRFLELLEGPTLPVETALQRIKANPIHKGCVILSRKSLDVRQFDQWNSACKGIDELNSGVAWPQSVDGLVANIEDPNIQAQFSSFARIRG